MWRMWNNISRVFRTHVYNPRPSAGLLVEDEPDSLDKCERAGRKTCSTTNYDQLGENVYQDGNKNVKRNHTDGRKGGYEDPCRENGQQTHTDREEGGEWQKTYHHDFWHLLHGHRSMFEAATWGPVFAWGSDSDSYNRKRARLLYRVLFALPSGGDSPVLASPKSVLPTITEEEQCEPRPVQRPPPKQLAIKDAAGAAIDQEINISKTETLELAMEEFQKVCCEYTACNENLLGLEAVEGGDMPAAITHLRRSCMLGNMSACFNLGLCYETGSGVPQDEHKAVSYYQKAAAGGHRMALYNLGLMCLRQKEEEDKGGGKGGKIKGGRRRRGRDTGLSREMGLDFLDAAAHLGLPEAQLYLGIHHMEECHEPSRAVSYFRAAANQNDSEAQYFLAMCYEHGLGVETNECLAARLYSQAAQAGHELALYNLGVFNEEGLGGLPKNKVAAVEMYQRAAELGNQTAEDRLEEMRASDSTVSSLRQKSGHGQHVEDGAEQKDTRVRYASLKPSSEQDTTAEDPRSLSPYDMESSYPLFSLQGSSASFPSLRSLSSFSLSKPCTGPLFSSPPNHHHQRDGRFTLHKKTDQTATTTVHQHEGFLEKVNLFLGLSPHAASFEHELGVSWGSNNTAADFSVHSMSPWTVSSAEEENQYMYTHLPNIHKSSSFSEFSMIGI